jgi:hypothetical protein
MLESALQLVLRGTHPHPLPASQASPQTPPRTPSLFSSPLHSPVHPAFLPRNKSQSPKMSRSRATTKEARHKQDSHVLIIIASGSFREGGRKHATNMRQPPPPDCQPLDRKRRDISNNNSNSNKSNQANKTSRKNAVRRGAPYRKGQWLFSIVVSLFAYTMLPTHIPSFQELSII